MFNADKDLKELPSAQPPEIRVEYPADQKAVAGGRRKGGRGDR
jgi:hypothetical protein